MHRARKWRHGLVSASFFGAVIQLAAALSMRPPVSKTARVQQADVFGPESPKVAPDLLLKKEDDAKAQAIAAFAAGIICEDSADSEKALENYQKALSFDPGYAELAVKIAFELARRGDVQGGIEILKDSIKSAPKEAVTYLYLSQLYGKYLKKPELAQKYAQQALELDAGNFASYLALYEIYLGTGQQKKAEQILERAAKLDNDDPEYWLQLGEFYMRSLLKDDGSPRHGPDDLKKMNAVFQKALALGEEDAAIITKVADFYVLSRQVKDAIPLYLKVVGLKQNSADPSLAAVRDKLAKSFRLNGQRDEAIAVLQQLIKEAPLRYETHELLGELYEEKGEMERALGSYQQTLLLDPAQPLNHLRVAELYLKTKNFKKAVETMREARQRFPQIAQMTYSLALALTQAKQRQDAVAMFEEARAEAESSHADMLNAEFYFNYGAASEQAGLIDKAVELLRKSIELDPGSAAQAYNYLGYMWADKGENLEEAGDFIKRAVEMDPENPAYLDSLGWWYFQKGDTEKALEQLQKAAAAIQPEDAVVYEHLGDAYGKSNNVAQALIYWQKAAALEPEDQKALAEKIENTKQKITAHPAPGTVKAPQ